MKIALRQENHCSVLDIQGDIDIHNFAVLKAGLSKLFASGKNRIVLNIVDGENLSSDVIRELAILDVFARELSGKLVLVSEKADLKQKVTSFAKPPVVAILPTVAKAVEYLQDLDVLEGDEAGESTTELAAQLEARTAEVAALKAQLSQANSADAQNLRQENATLKDKVALLESQVGELAAKRRQPVDAEGFLEKYEALEETIRKLSGEKTAAK
ncbi:MAG: STAS domain-containing protein [Bdellovibrionota bacterium]